MRFDYTKAKELYETETMPLKEIANLCGIPEGTFRMWIWRNDEMEG